MSNPPHTCTACGTHAIDPDLQNVHGRSSHDREPGQATAVHARTGPADPEHLRHPGLPRTNALLSAIGLPKDWMYVRDCCRRGAAWSVSSKGQMRVCTMCTLSPPYCFVDRPDRAGSGRFLREACICEGRKPVRVPPRAQSFL